NASSACGAARAGEKLTAVDELKSGLDMPGSIAASMPAWGIKPNDRLFEPEDKQLTALQPHASSRSIPSAPTQYAGRRTFIVRLPAIGAEEEPEAQELAEDIRHPNQQVR